MFFLFLSLVLSLYFSLFLALFKWCIIYEHNRTFRQIRSPIHACSRTFYVYIIIITVMAWLGRTEADRKHRVNGPIPVAILHLQICNNFCSLLLLLLLLANGWKACIFFSLAAFNQSPRVLKPFSWPLDGQMVTTLKDSTMTTILDIPIGEWKLCVFMKGEPRSRDSLSWSHH